MPANSRWDLIRRLRVNGLVFATETKNTEGEDKTKLLKGQILGAFSKLQKATVSFVKSVRPSVRPTAWNNSSSTGRIFIFESFSEICPENPSFIKITQE